MKPTGFTVTMFFNSASGSGVGKSLLEQEVIFR